MKTALIIGGARSGIGCALLLNQQGFDVTLTTNKDFNERASLEYKGIHVSLNDRDLELANKHYDYVIKNPGIPNDHPLVASFDFVFNEIEIAAMIANDYDFYAVSGTNGKTTTTSMLYEMLRKKNDSALCAGNIGLALSEAVYKTGNQPLDVALEISAFQMEGTPSFAPKVYGLLNLSPDHLDRYPDAEDYYNAKLSIIPRVGTFIMNDDDPNSVQFVRNINVSSIIRISLDHDADVMLNNNWIYFHEVRLFDSKTLKLVGNHNLFNATMAATIAYLAGVDIPDIQSVIASFKGVEHRIEYVDTIDGVRFYNDSKATNPESTEVCLQSFDQNIILLAGGFDKNISFSRLKPYESRIKQAFLFGESAEQINQVFTNAIRVDTMLEAFENAWAIASPGDVIVLSPACASYDQFDNYEARGQIFKQYIKTLK